MARFASLRAVVPAASVALLVVVGGCASGRKVTPCDPCAEPAPCAAPCVTDPCAVEAPPRPDGACGEVWCKVWIPPVTCTEMETVCVKPACKKAVWVPPVYGTRPKLCQVSAPKMSESVRPGVYETRTRDVLLRPEQDRWDRVCCPPVTDGSGCPMPQECWQKTCTPAQWGQEQCTVCVEPEKYCVKYTPGQYQVVEERYLLSPGRCEEVEEPPVFENRFREVCVQPGRWEWRRNTSCEPPPPAPEFPALQVEMKDRNEQGQEEGVFRVGAIVRYDLIVLADQSKSALTNLKVAFSLPPELEFVSGGGEEGVAVTGAGNAASTSLFSIPVDGSIGLHVLARVKDASAGTNVQFTATVQTADGTTLAIETESTTIGGGGSAAPQ